MRLINGRCPIRRRLIKSLKRTRGLKNQGGQETVELGVVSVPPFPDCNHLIKTLSVNGAKLHSFVHSYRNHLVALCAAWNDRRVEAFEPLLQSFWSGRFDHDVAAQLSQTALNRYITECDTSFYSVRKYF